MPYPRRFASSKGGSKWNGRGFTFGQNSGNPLLPILLENPVSVREAAPCAANGFFKVVEDECIEQGFSFQQTAALARALSQLHNSVTP